MRNLTSLFVIGLIVAGVFAAIKYSGVLSATPDATEPARLITIAHTALPTKTMTPPPTDDPLVYARATIMAGDAAATREQGARIAAATSTAWVFGQERTATWSAVQVVSAGLAFSQTQIAAVQTEIVVRSQIISATEEYFVSPLRVQATQTAIAADSMARANAGMAWSVFAWVISGSALVGLALLARVLYATAKSGQDIVWRLIDAKVRLHENEATSKETDTWLKANRIANPPTEKHVIDEPANRKAWYENMWRFFSWGIKNNTFVNSKMDDAGANIISNSNWDFVTKFYTRQGVLMIVKGKTALGVGWNEARIRQEMDAGTFPYPIGMEPVLVSDQA